MGKTVGIARRNLLGAEAAVLPSLDLRQQQARRPAPLVDILRLQDLFEESDLIISIEDRKARFEPDRLGVPAQDP